MFNDFYHLKTESTITEFSFDAWGRRRDKDDWSYTLTSEPALFADRGFTAHEFLSDFNLYNMNGRLYDPVVGRFLSPDPFISDPSFSQSYNRYAFALNNPLKYIDPSGEFIWQWLVAMAGNYLFGVADNTINKGMPLQQAFKATPIVGGINFSPGNFNQKKYNYGISNYQVDAHDLVQNELKFEQRYDRWEYTQRGRTNQRGIFGTDYEMGPVGIGVNIELGLPEWAPWATHNTGFSISLGFVADANDRLDFYVTEGRPMKNNVSFSLSPEVFYVKGSHGRKIYNSDLVGNANQFGVGLSIFGGSVSAPDNFIYRQWTLSGMGYGIDIGTGSWRTYTRLYKLYER